MTKQEYDKLFVNYIPQLRSVLKKYTTDYDIINDTYIRGLQYLPSFDESNYFKGWIARIAISIYLNNIKKRKIPIDEFLHILEIDSIEDNFNCDEQLHIIKTIIPNQYEKLVDYYDKSINLNRNSTLRTEVMKIKRFVLTNLKAA